MNISEKAWKIAEYLNETDKKESKKIAEKIGSLVIARYKFPPEIEEVKLKNELINKFAILISCSLIKSELKKLALDDLLVFFGKVRDFLKAFQKDFSYSTQASQLTIHTEAKKLSNEIYNELKPEFKHLSKAKELCARISSVKDKFEFLSEFAYMYINFEITKDLKNKMLSLPLIYTLEEAKQIILLTFTYVEAMKYGWEINGSEKKVELNPDKFEKHKSRLKNFALAFSNVKNNEECYEKFALLAKSLKEPTLIEAVNSWTNEASTKSIEDLKKSIFREIKIAESQSINLKGE